MQTDHENLRLGLPVALLCGVALAVGWMAMQRPGPEAPPSPPLPVTTPPPAALPVSAPAVAQPLPASVTSAAVPATLQPPPLSLEAAQAAARAPDRSLSPRELEDRSWAISALAS